jgi:hypothetical protein
MRSNTAWICALAASAALLCGCSRSSPHVLEVVSAQSTKLTLEPLDAAWNGLPEHVAKLLPQDLVEPRVLKPTTPEVRVRSLQNGAEIAFRLEWVDANVNDLPGMGRFLDGCAVQIPSRIEANAPDPQMGQAKRPVEVTFWRADWQASVNGRKDDLQALYPNTTVDHHPFNAKPLAPGSPEQKQMAMRYAPAEAVGNRRVGPRESPVEELVAEGPGSLAPAASPTSRGRGVRTKDGWTVVLARRYPTGLSAKTRTQVAFAVWDGSQHEVGARKMRTGWIPLVAREAAR